MSAPPCVTSLLGLGAGPYKQTINISVVECTYIHSKPAKDNELISYQFRLDLTLLGCCCFFFSFQRFGNKNCK